MIVDIEIQHIGLEGQGVGFDGENNIYFIRGAVPGDHVRASYEDQKRYRNAELVEILRPSAERREPACQYFGDCGGCDWLQWDYTAQLRAKQALVERVLARAELDVSTVRPILASPNELGYRSRIQLHREGDAIGFHRRRSHDLISISNCAITQPSVNAEIPKLRSHTGEWKRAEISIDDNGVVGVTYDDAPSEFSQVNSAQNESLRGLVTRTVQESGAKNVLELYCGNGNLTQAYAPHVEMVVGVDSSETSIARARTRLNEPSKIIFFVDGVNRKLRKKLPAEIKDRYDTLVLDPPRPGVGKSLQHFVHRELKTVIYVSCSPVTFSQDAKLLAEQGLVLRSVQPLDMFPQTRHIELCSVFSRP